ncbi:MAG: hypothetical protein JGK08_28670, partial [Microcoleus sp. PH2017_04_SCI_O_A]|nr:hypothetical protein [Microcoleus sp. PH2017_04_SCI_O_A]
MYSGVSPQKILSQTSKIERATCRHKKSLAKHQKSSGRRTCPLVRSQIKSIAYNQTNPLEPEIRRNCQMLDAALLGGLFTVVWQAILGTQVNDAAKHLCLTGIKKVSRNGKIVNHDLEKALKRSFLKAQQQIASECHKELVEPSRRASKGIVIYLPQHRPDLEWLDKKIKQLKSELEKVDKETVPSGIP